MDGTHIKVVANSHKYRKEMVDQQAKFMSEQLEVEIDLDRKKHEKKTLKPAKESKAKGKKSQRRIPSVVGFTRANIRRYLPILLKLLMISIVGPWLIRLKQEMLMTVKLSLPYFQS